MPELVREVTLSPGPQIPPVSTQQGFGARLGGVKHLVKYPAGRNRVAPLRKILWKLSNAIKMFLPSYFILRASSPSSSFPWPISLSLSLSVSQFQALSVFISLCLSFPPLTLPLCPVFPLSLFLCFTCEHTGSHTHAGLYTHSCMLLALDAFSSAVSELTSLSCASRKHVLISIIFQVSLGSTETLPSCVHLRRTGDARFLLCHWQDIRILHCAQIVLCFGCSNIARETHN